MTSEEPAPATERRPPVVIVDYDAAWPEQYEAARATIERACGDALVAIEHVGSTSVPGLPAKPIIDIQPGLRRFEDGLRCVEAMQAAGYEYRGEYGMPGRHYFVRAALEGLPAQHVHMSAVDDENWRERLLFRDYLRAHPEQATEYARLKRDLAARFGRDREGYTEAKTEFVRSMLALAGEWDARGRPGA